MFQRMRQHSVSSSIYDMDRIGILGKHASAEIIGYSFDSIVQRQALLVVASTDSFRSGEKDIFHDRTNMRHSIHGLMKRKAPTVVGYETRFRVAVQKKSNRCLNLNRAKISRKTMKRKSSASIWMAQGFGSCLEHLPNFRLDLSASVLGEEVKRHGTIMGWHSTGVGIGSEDEEDSLCWGPESQCQMKREIAFLVGGRKSPRGFGQQLIDSETQWLDSSYTESFVQWNIVSYMSQLRSLLTEPV